MDAGLDGVNYRIEGSVVGCLVLSLSLLYPILLLSGKAVANILLKSGVAVETLLVEFAPGSTEADAAFKAPHDFG